MVMVGLTLNLQLLLIRMDGHTTQHVVTILGLMMMAIHVLLVNTVQTFTHGLLMTPLRTTSVEHFATTNGVIAMAIPMVTTTHSMLGIEMLSHLMEPNMPIPMRMGMGTTLMAIMRTIVQTFGAIQRLTRKDVPTPMVMDIRFSIPLISTQRLA
jgi:hypothetical protein